MSRPEEDSYRAAMTHRMPHLYRSFSTKEPYNSWLFGKKRPATGRAESRRAPQDFDQSPCSWCIMGPLRGGGKAQYPVTCLMCDMSH